MSARCPDLLGRVDGAAAIIWATVVGSPRFVNSAPEDLMTADEACRDSKPAAVVVTSDDLSDELARVA